MWKFASVDDGINPDVYAILCLCCGTSLILQRSVLVGIGVEVNFEVIAAAALLRTHAPALRVRVINVTDLMILSADGTHPHSLTHHAFSSLFTEDKPIHFNFHGYPIELQGLLHGRPIQGRVSIGGSVLYLLFVAMKADHSFRYMEEGTTTSPFDVRVHPYRVSPSNWTRLDDAL